MRGCLTIGLSLACLAVTYSPAAWATEPVADESEPSPVAAAAPPTAPEATAHGEEGVSPPGQTERVMSDSERRSTPKDVRSDIPVLAYTYTAYGASAGSIGVQANGLGRVAPGQRALAGGGATMWGSPIDRLTLIGDGARDLFGNFAPSAAVVVRVAGKAGDGWSLGALGKFKIEGFGTGPNGETESEIESGVLVSYARAAWHLDANAIGGMGTGDSGEVDVEGRLRLGRDLGHLARIGLDGQMRVRATGDKPLPGGRKWDFAGGPQLLVGSGHFFGALTAGPATMGVVDNIGWTAIASLGGTTL